MDFKKEIINIRTTRLNNIILGISDSQFKLPKSSTGLLNREGLLDSLILLYDECNKDGLCRKDKNIQEFITKHNSVIAETKALRVNSSDFEVKKLIGKGHFGEVHLVVEKQTNDVYAMKKITKALVNSSHFKEERDIMACYNSEWITSLQYAFQDIENLYLIMEYLPGGDLLSLMERFGPFEENDVKFYLAEIAYALNELHNIGFVHRDVKPENILIDRCGHLKLADFGNAAPLNKDEDATVLSPAGTPEYIAPEILDTLNSKRPFRIKQCVLCDYWGMGIIGYEFITESTPFHGNNQLSIYDNITNHCRHSKKLTYPDNIEVSTNYRNLIDKLVTNPEQRLTFAEIKKHPFFVGIQWEDLRNEVAPIIPNIASDDDVSNFNQSPNKAKQDTFIKSPSQYLLKNNEFSGLNLPYVGYTFVRHEQNIALAGSESDDRKTKVKLTKYEQKVHDLTKEIKKLQTDILAAQRKSSRNESLEKILTESKNELYSMKDKLNEKTAELASSRAEIEKLRCHLKIERENALKNDAKITDIFRAAHEKYEKEKYAADKMHERLIFEKNNELSHINEKLKNIETKLNDKLDQCEHLEKAISNYKEILKQSKQQLEVEKKENEENKMVIQKAYEAKLAEFRGKLKAEKDVKTQKCNEINELRMELNESVCSSTSITENKEASDRAIDDLKRQLTNQMQINSEIHESNVKLEKEYALLQMHYDNFRKDVNKLKEVALESNRSSGAKSDDSSQFKSANDSFVEIEEQLRNDLIVAKENENLSLKKIKDFEEVIKTLEQTIIHLQQPSKNNEVLEKKNERLEDKLEAIREQAMVDRQSARTANLTVYRLEKSLEDFGLEKKALLRRLELSDTKQLKWKEEKLEIESKLKQTTETIQLKEQLIHELKREIDLLKVELKNESDLCKNTEKDRMKEKYEVISSIVKIKNLEEKLAENNKKLYAIQNKSDHLQRENNKMAQELNDCQNTIAELSDSQSAAQQDYHISKRNYNMLVQACKITESQLNEIETMYENEVKRNKSHMEKIDELWAKIRSKDEEIKLVKTDLNQEIHGKKVIEQKLADREKELTEFKGTNQNLTKQCIEQQKDLIEKSKILCSIQEDIEMAKLDSSNLQRVKSHINQELSILKEENAKILTDLYLTKEELQKMINELKDSRNLNADYKGEIDHITSTMSEIKNYYHQREIKYETTLAQHAKLINHLQVQVEDSKIKKKKNFSEILFGSSSSSSSKLQNLPLSAIENSASFKRLQQEYRLEKSRNERLTEQLLRVKTDLREQNHNKENHIGKYATAPPPTNNSTPRTEIKKLDIVAQVHPRPQSAASCDELDKHHRFEMTIDNQTNEVCKPCDKPIMGGSTFWKCKQCKATVHRKCRGNVNSLCDTDITITPSEQDINDLCTEIFDGEDRSDSGSVDIPNEKSLFHVVLVPEKYESNLVVNTAYELDEDVLLLGCNSGLYSYHLETKSLVHIAGIDGVEYIAITATVSKAILIGSQGENLYQCDLRHLQSRGQAHSCLNPKLDVVLLEYAFLRKLPNEKYHYAKIHGDNNKLQDVRVVAGTTARILIFQYDVQVAKFTPLRALDTAIPISSVLFTAHTVIISSDKFFEVDLKTFDYEELLDFSDKSIKHAQNTRPIAAFRINKEEYLLCFMEFGIFVDEFGCRSRSNDINWMTNRPTGFTYREPLLYISHPEQIEILFINKSYSKVLEVANYNDNIMCKENNYKKQILIALPHTKILADVGPYGILATAENRSTQLTELLHVNGAKMLKTELECSMDSLFTITSNATTFGAESSN